VLVTDGDEILQFDTTSSDYGPVETRTRSYETYLRPWLEALGARRVLDVGCGPGTLVSEMVEDGYDAMGVDLPCIAPTWERAARDPDRFVCANAVHLPFGDQSFDAVVCLGLIEHIGTISGHTTLSATWRADREAFTRGLVRVTRRQGRILLGGPNKSFPLDPQHGPHDDVQRAGRLRDWFFRRSGMNLHPVVGDYHLPSYRDVRHWFRGQAWQAMPLEGFFGFSVFEDPEGRPGAPRSIGTVAQRYVEGLPKLLRSTPLNPYVLIEVTA
jgi:SAM-dependent methyltransferase